MQLNMSAVKGVTGAEAKEKMVNALAILNTTYWPMLFTGPSGAGKTHIAFNVARAYAKQHNVGVDYIQLSPDQTKTTVIGGHRLYNGSLVTVKGTVAKAMEAGNILIVDECTHTLEEMLLMFNSLMDRLAVVSIGDIVLKAAPSFRIIFCSNDSSYAGNVSLPQSFARRLIAFNFDYPSAETEAAIAMDIAKSEFAGDVTAPLSVAKYVVAFMRQMREFSKGLLPLSAANVAATLVLCEIAPKRVDAELDPHFESASGAVAAMVSKRILGTEITDAAALATHPEIAGFVDYVSSMGVERFREVVKQTLCYYLDIDGIEHSKGKIKSEFLSAII